MSFPKYPKYKDSGVQWLGEVPAHWEVDRIKRRCEVFPSNVDKKMHEGEKPVLLCNYTDVYYNDCIVAGLEFMAASASDDQIDRFTLKSGDTIITKDSETADDIGISAFVPNDLPGVVCGYHLTMIRPSVGIDGAFVKRLFDAHSTKAHLAVSANGLTRVGLGQYALDNLTFAWPPLEEQTAIATFLDHETAKIDALVAEQEKLIALLQEKRQAVISHAVTKGLDPNVPMKDSGVEWLGEVPAHWEIQRIKNVSPHITVGIVVEPSRYYVEEGVPALRSLNVRPGGIVKENMVMISDTANEEQQKSRLRAGDLVAVRTGQPGTTAVVPTELDNCNCIDLIIIRKPTNGFASFLCWFLNSSPAQRQFSAGSGGAIQQHFNVELAKSLVITWPPEDEQIMISDHLSKITNEFDLLIDEGRTAITLLQERRTALISAAVTGQIDVRGLAGASNAPESIAANAYP